MSLMPMGGPIWGGMGVPTTVPTQPNQMEGLLGNPYLQMGLGILGNNTGHYGQLGPALGKGMSQGLQQVQASRQFDQQSKLYQLKLAEAQRESEQYQARQEAIRKAAEKNPEFADLYQLDPKAAIKAAYPNVNTADPFTEVIYDDQGRAWLNNRRETDPNQVLKPITINGVPFIGAKQSPELAGRIEGAKSQAGAAWTPNTDIDGLLTTDERVVRDVYGNSPIPFSNLPTGVPPQAPQVGPQPPQSGLPSNNFNTPYPVTMGAPGTTATDRMEGTVTDNLGVGNPARPNPVGGIRVPTKAEIEQTKADIDKQKQLEIDAVKTENADKKSVPGRNDALFSVQKAKGLLDQGIYTGAYANIQKSAAKFTPFVDKSTAARTETFLAEIGNTVVPRLQEFGGNDSVEEMNYLKAIMGGNIELEEDAIRSILDSVEMKIQRGIDRHNKGLDANGQPKADRQQIIPSGAAGGNVPKTYDALPKKAPKGQIVRNPQTGERMQFDGMRWKPL